MDSWGLMYVQEAKYVDLEERNDRTKRSKVEPEDFWKGKEKDEEVHGGVGDANRFEEERSLETLGGRLCWCGPCCGQRLTLHNSGCDCRNTPGYHRRHERIRDAPGPLLIAEM